MVVGTLGSTLLRCPTAAVHTRSPLAMLSGWTRTQGLANRHDSTGPHQRRSLSSVVAKTGDVVSVHYKGMLVDGRIFMNTTKSKEGPVTFTVGKNEVIEGLENAVLNMCVGQEKVVHLQPPTAFGEISPELIVHISASKVPAESYSTIETGKWISVKLPSNNLGDAHVEGQVIATTPKGLTVDLNHPLAGETVIFELKLLSVGSEPTSAA